jgi:hypothetical protein
MKASSDTRGSKDCSKFFTMAHPFTRCLFM